jgi:hypothetical protein
MSWLSDMFRAPNFQKVNTQNLYGMADRYRDPMSNINQGMFSQMSKQGHDATAMQGYQGQRMAGMGMNPFADSQYNANYRRMQDQVLGGFSQYMQGQNQLGLGYDQLGMQGDQYNSQMQAQMQALAMQNRAGGLGMGIGALAGLSGGFPGFISGLFKNNSSPGIDIPNYSYNPYSNIA